jgi:aryl-alcohol dehydrogenase-like predicted oxidoreductase
VLTGKYVPGAPIPEGSRAADPMGSGFIAKWLEDDVLTRVQALRPLAEEAGLTMAQMAVAWVLGNPNVSAAIVGASRPEQLQDSVQASGVVLDEDLREAIDDVLGDAIVRDPALTASPAERP